MDRIPTDRHRLDK